MVFGTVLVVVRVLVIGVVGILGVFMLVHMMFDWSVLS